VLFQHGAFTAGDTEATASIVRVYAFGLIGQALVGVLCRAFFSSADRTWYPAAAMLIGLAVTALITAVAVRRWGAEGIAAADATGITVAAVLLLIRLHKRVIAVSYTRLGLPSDGSPSPSVGPQRSAGCWSG
jgi:putative peptidoglycan lipid II flippase